MRGDLREEAEQTCWYSGNGVPGQGNGLAEVQRGWEGQGLCGAASLTDG